MFVKYVSHPNATLTTIKSDIVTLMSGSIATANDFGVNCNKTSTLVYGSFPANTYAVVNSSAMAFSKNHNDYTGKTYYFRINFSGNNWTSITTSGNYTAANDTFANTNYTRSFPNTGTSSSPMAPQSATAGVTFYIIAGAETFHMDTPTYSGNAAKSVTLCDISHSGLTREFSNSVLMAGFDQISNTFANANSAFGVALPAANGDYFTQASNGANLTLISTALPSTPMVAANGSQITIETPVFVYHGLGGNTHHYVYGVSRTSTRTIEAYRTYTDKDSKVKVILPANNSFSLALNAD